MRAINKPHFQGMGEVKGNCSKPKDYQAVEMDSNPGSVTLGLYGGSTEKQQHVPL